MTNTLSVSNQFSKTGVGPEQAEAIADVIVDPDAQKNENLAIREFMYDACRVVQSRINAWHGRMCAQKNWIVGMRTAVTGALFAGGLFF